MENDLFVVASVIAKGASGDIERVKGTEGSFQGQVYARKLLKLPARKSIARADMTHRIETVVNTFKPVRHDHVLRIVTTYSFKDFYAIIMDPLADMDLRQYLQIEETPQAREKISRWFGCLISGLAFLHDMGIKHGDIKPSHVLIKNDAVLLTVSSTNGQWRDTSRSTTTNRHSITTIYIAPEVLEGYEQGSKGDIFSLGAVFLEMFIVGSHSQRIEELERFKYSGRIDTTRMDALSQTPDKLPWHSTVARLCAEMLQVNPNDRPKAGDLRLWWSYQPLTVLPWTPCKCSLAASGTDHWSPARIKDALETAREKDYAMSIELLSGNSAERGSKKILSAFKGLLRRSRVIVPRPPS